MTSENFPGTIQQGYRGADALSGSRTANHQDVHLRRGWQGLGANLPADIGFGTAIAADAAAPASTAEAPGNERRLSGGM
jgi:hypothetical protein